MGAEKLSVSFDAELGAAVRAAAKLSGGSLSAWLAEAAAAKLRAESLAAYLDEWEAEHGAFTDEEMAQAARDLALPEPSGTQPESGHEAAA